MIINIITSANKLMVHTQVMLTLKRAWH